MAGITPTAGNVSLPFTFDFDNPSNPSPTRTREPHSFTETGFWTPPPIPNEPFPTCNEAFRYCQEWGKTHGYALSHYSGGEAGGRLVLVCDKGGRMGRTAREQAQMEQRERDGRSRKGARGTTNSGCPFKLTLRLHDDKKWHLLHTNSIHMHDPENPRAQPNPNEWDPSQHPQHRRLTPDSQLALVEEQTKAGVVPGKIIAALTNRYPSCVASTRTIYNAQEMICRKALKGRSPIQALLDELKADAQQFRIDNGFRIDLNTSAISSILFDYT